jgi:cleavage and polyadenylation specificity factor subunit 4
MEEEGIRFDFEDAIAEHESTVQQNQLSKDDQRGRNYTSVDSQSSDRIDLTKRLFPKKYKNNYNRDKTTVCLYWIRGLCWNGESCDYLHEYDIMKLPLCLSYKKNGYCENQQKGCCLFSHELPKSDNDTPICIHYFLGFCRSGPRCRKKHEQLTPDKLPKLLPDWYLHLILSNAQSVLPTTSDPETEALMQDVDAMCRNLENSGNTRNDATTLKTSVNSSAKHALNSNKSSTYLQQQSFPIGSVKSTCNVSPTNERLERENDANWSKFARVHIDDSCIKVALEKG